MDDRKKNIILLILLFIIIVLIVLIAVVSTSKNNQNTITIDNIQLRQNNLNYERITQLEAERIVEDELSILNDKKSMSEISDQNKLSLALRTLINDEANIGIYSETFTSDNLESAFSKTSLAKLMLNHGNIEKNSTDGTFNTSYLYNNGIYTKIEDFDCDLSKVLVIDKRVVAFINQNEKYIISIKYLWGPLKESLIDDNSLYGSFDNSVNRQNSLYNYDLPQDDTVLKEWFSDNYESIKDNLDTYNYVFVKENGKIYLVDFYID